MWVLMLGVRHENLEYQLMQISLQEAATQLTHLAHLAAKGESIIIVADGLPNLELTIAPSKIVKRKAGTLKHAITIIDKDWDKPSDEINAEFYK
jgi:hypothetical protein